MATKKFIRKITKRNKYSYSTVLPKELIKKFSWRDRHKIIIRKYGKNKILIEDWKPKK